MEIQPYRPEDREALIALWRECKLTRPWNDPQLDIQRKLAEQPDLLLVGRQDGRVVASVMVGYDGHRGWINYLAVAGDCRRKGLGRAMMAEAERLLAQRGCPKVNLQVRASNHDVIDFYRRIGYSPDEVVSMGKRLVDDSEGPAE
ncbi:MAG: GNAT family acetyltransferase [Planctomycetota bacterium]